MRQKVAGEAFRAAEADAETMLLEVVTVVAQIAFAAFDPVLLEIATCLLGIKAELKKGTTFAGLSEHLMPLPCMAAHKSKIKSILAGFGSFSNLLHFIPHRTIYFLGGVQAAKDELVRVEEKDSGTSECKVKLERVIRVMTDGLAILRQIVSQISSYDVEFIEENPWVSTNEEAKTKHIKSWASRAPNTTMFVVLPLQIF